MSNLKQATIYNTLKNKCNGKPEVLALLDEIWNWCTNKLKTVIKYMPEYTLHDETHISNMIKLVNKLLPKEILEELFIPDLMMIIISIAFHDIGMCIEEKSLTQIMDYISGKRT